MTPRSKIYFKTKSIIHSICRDEKALSDLRLQIGESFMSLVNAYREAMKPIPKYPNNAQQNSELAMVGDVDQPERIFPGFKFHTKPLLPTGIVREGTFEWRFKFGGDNN